MNYELIHPGTKTMLLFIEYTTLDEIYDHFIFNKKTDYTYGFLVDSIENGYDCIIIDENMLHFIDNNINDFQTQFAGMYDDEEFFFKLHYSQISNDFGEYHKIYNNEIDFKYVDELCGKYKITTMICELEPKFKHTLSDINLFKQRYIDTMRKYYEN